MNNLIVKLLVNIGAKCASVLLMLLFHLYLARNLSPSEYGTFAFYQVLAIGFSIFAQRGMHITYMRFLSEILALNLLGQIKPLTLYVLRKIYYTIVISSVACIIAIFCTKNPDISIVILLLFYIISQSILFVLMAWYRANDLAYIATLLEQGGYSGIAIAILWLIGCNSIHDISLEVSFIVVVGSSWIVLLIAVLHPVIRIIRLSGDSGFYQTEEVDKSSNNTWITSLSNYIFLWSGVIITGLFLSEADSGILNIAQRLAQVVTFFLLAFNGVLAPKFAEKYAKQDLIGMKSIAQKSAWLLLIVTFPIIILLLLFGYNILSGINQTFAQGYTLLVILLIGQTVNILTGSVGFLLIMSRNERLVRNIVAFTGGVTVILSILLVRDFGLIGIASAISISLIINNLALSYYAYKIHGVVLIPSFQWISN